MKTLQTYQCIYFEDQIGILYDIDIDMSRGSFYSLLGYRCWSLHIRRYLVELTKIIIYRCSKNVWLGSEYKYEFLNVFQVSNNNKRLHGKHVIDIPTHS